MIRMLQSSTLSSLIAVYGRYVCYLRILLSDDFAHNGGGSVAGESWFHVGRPCVRPYVRLPYVRRSAFSFADDDFGNFQ